MNSKNPHHHPFAAIADHHHDQPITRERFAPSPTGLLHLGHAFSAKLGHDLARARGGQWLLRIEDIDHRRSKSEYCQAICDDLCWLGLQWDGEVVYQSRRLDAYAHALAKLRELGVIYGCACTRSDLKAAMSAPQLGVEAIPAYPRTCALKNLQGDNLAWRLDIRKAFALCPELSYFETGFRDAREIHVNQADIEAIGDVVMARRDIGTSYHLAVVVDDEFQNITHVTRGRDIAHETCIHVLLQKLLCYKTPIYHHHALILDDAGKRLAKRDHARSIAHYRALGASPKDILEMIKIFRE